MIKAALEYITNMKEATLHTINDNVFSDKQLHKIKEPLSTGIGTTTLTSLIDYIKSNPDGISEDEELLVHVESESKVIILSSLNINMERNVYMECFAKTPKIQLDSFLDTERFNIMMQACFLDNPDKAEILKLIGNVKEENVRTTGDNGINQIVTAKVGIAQVGDAKVPNPVTLIPFRTFIEIDQPESKYVFRMKDGPSCALFEADGGEWRLKAMLRIKEYLQNNLKEHSNVKILA